jgi:hypothetical protein
MPGRILFKTTPDGTQTPVEAMRIDSAQNVTLATGNLVIGTSGKGIDFSATSGTGTSELLNDYEEGTFTPGLDANGGAATLSTAVGRYTKIGRMVFVQIRVTCSAAPSGANVVLRDLPFASSSAANNFNVSAVFYGSVTYLGSPILFMNPGATTIFACSQASAGGLTLLDGSAFASTASVTVNFFYHV